MVTTVQLFLGLHLVNNFYYYLKQNIKSKKNLKFYYYNVELLATLNKLPLNYPASVLYYLALICEDKMGGASGALYSLLLTGAAGHLAFTNDLDWTGALKNALETAMIYSSARKGDKTMVII